MEPQRHFCVGGGRVGHGALGLLASLELLVGVFDSLVVDVGVDVAFDLLPKFGRYEAANIRLAAAP